MERKRQDRRPTAEESCPKNVICDCPVSYLNDEKCRRIDADYIIEKLRELVSDPITSDHVARISQLLTDYLREIGDKGYVSFDLHVLKKNFFVRELLKLANFLWKDKKRINVTPF